MKKSSLIAITLVIVVIVFLIVIELHKIAQTPMLI